MFNMKEEVISSYLRKLYDSDVNLYYVGPSKMTAKNNASEKALRDIIIQRMLQSPKNQQLKIGDLTIQQAGSGTVYKLNEFILS